MFLDCFFDGFFQLLFFKSFFMLYYYFLNTSTED